MMVRVFLPALATFECGHTVILDPSESHYLTRVRRVGQGATIEALDGVSQAFSAVVISVDSHASRIELGAPRPTLEGPYLCIGLGLPAPTATLAAMTAATESGASEIALVRCARSSAATPSQARLERVIRAAQRQCGRARPPTVVGPMALTRWLDRDRAIPGYFGAPDTDSAIVLRDHARGVRLLIGPEGGLEPREVTEALHTGLCPLRLGAYILRTETAVVAGLAVLQAQLGHPSSTFGASSAP